MPEDSIYRGKDALGAGVPLKAGTTGGSFAEAAPNREGVVVLADAIPAVVTVNGSFEPARRQEHAPAYPASLPPADVAYSFGDEDGVLYVHVRIPGADSDVVGVTVWHQDGDRCDSLDNEETGYDEDVEDGLLEWAHSVRESIDQSEARRRDVGLDGEVHNAIVAAATGRPVTVTPAPLTVDFDDPNIDELTDEQVRKLLSAIVDRTGMISPIIDEAEALTRLFELPQSDSAEDKKLNEIVSFLERELGGKAKLARAVTETQAWADLEETMLDALADEKRGVAVKIVEAIEQINAVY